MPVTDIEVRLSDIEARIAISELRSMYCWYTVRGAQSEVLKLFTDDGVFENSRNAEGVPVVVVGKEALAQHFARIQPARRVPLVTNEVTRVEGETAEGTCAMLSVGNDGFAGHYVDHFRRVDGAWRFSRRQFFPYWPVYGPDTEHVHP